MSETTTTTTEATAAPAPAEAAPTPKDVADATKGRPAETPEQTISGLREALAKANAEAKENRIKARELDELKNAQMSDIERAQAEAKRAREALAEVEKGTPKKVADTLRAHLAAIHGISDEDTALYLTSDDPETLVKQAAGLAAKSSTPTTPKPDLTQGGANTPPALNSSALENALRAKLGAS